MTSAALPERPAVCAHPVADPLWGGVLARCRDCRLVFTRAIPAFAYTREYFAGPGIGAYDFDSAFAQAADAERFGEELDRLAAQGLSGSILDIGCATGTFLSHARARGFDVAGIELSDWARAEAGRRLGIDVAASLSELPAGRRFDVVTLHHVLEHVHEPARFLADEVRPRVARLVLIEVPNFASLGAQLDGPRWRDLRPEQHVHHFEPATLERLVASSGFEVRRVYTLFEPLWSLRAAVRTLATLRALAGPREFESVDPLPPSAAEATDWTPRRGPRGAVTSASRVLFRPLVRWIERTQRGERLVLEARPAAGRS